MEAVAAYPGKKKTPGRLMLFLERWWTAVITVGITDDLDAWEKKRTRLLNGICAMSAVVLITYCIIYSDARHRLTFWESFIGLVASVIPIYLNYKRLYVVACHFFCIYNLLSYSFQAISHGYVDGVEYILVASSIASMLFFKSMRVVVTYFILNGLFFALCKYSFTVMEPFLFMPDGENVYLGNHIILFVIVFLIVLYFKSENARQENLLEARNAAIATEMEKSEKLLLNILPAETATELKETGVAIAKSHKMVTVLFTDFKNFTGIAEKLTPEKLVAEINYCYSRFDHIVHDFDVEKIKTVGDAYMCAGGLPEENDTNPVDVIMAALEIRRFMQDYKKEREAAGEPFFEVRIGIHTGPVVAGIVGTKKFAYDIWGDTVNIAARMESSGEVGRINISGATHALVRDRFRCTYRGKIPARNRGEIDMYFVDGLVDN